MTAFDIMDKKFEMDILDSSFAIKNASLKKCPRVRAHD
jgi:hypothetical protein